MSETIDDAPHGASQEETASQPATDTTTAPAPGTEQTTQTEEVQKPAEPPKPDPKDRAIRQLAYEAREAKRQAAEAREALEKAIPRDPNAQPTPADLDKIIEERVQQAIAQREQAKSTEAWIASGNAEYPDFTERCNALAEMGAGSNPTFMTAVAKVPAGHKVVAELAANPAEADRVLRLSPVEMAVELAVMAQRLTTAPPPPPKPTKAAPAPIRPITGTARAEPDPSNMSGDEYLAWYRAQRVKNATR